MREPLDPSSDDGGFLFASSPTGSLLAARFSWFLVALNVISPSRLHGARVFKELSRPPPRMAGWYGQTTVP